MIKIELPDRTLGISFIHKKKILPVTEGFTLKGPTHWIAHSTKCEILEIPERGQSSILIVLAYGIANCDRRDNFSKEVGRKIALTHALFSEQKDGKKYSKFTKFERSAIWEAYWNRGVEDIVLQIERENRNDIIVGKGAE